MWDFEVNVTYELVNNLIVSSVCLHVFLSNMMKFYLGDHLFSTPKTTYS